METRKVGVLASVVSALSLGAQIIPGVLLARWLEGGPPELPVMLGTAGQTAVILTSIVETSGPLVTLLLSVSLGYYVGKRISVQSHYRRFLGAIGVGSAIGVVVPWVGVLALGSSFSPFDGGAILVIVVTFVQILVTVSLGIIVGAFAGVALAHFQKQRRSPPGSKRPDT